MCPFCGALLAARPMGGLTHCDRCGEECEVPPRPALRRDELLPNPVTHEDAEEVSVPEHGAMDAWQSARARAERGEDEGSRLATLTRHLYAHARGPDRDRERRALLESALEVSAPPHDAEMAALLSKEALDAGDAAAAEDWLRRIEIWPEERRAHVAYALAVARVATARRQWARVLEVLGAAPADFEAEGEEALVADLLRAHALEETATLDDARLALEPTIHRHGAELVALRAAEVMPSLLLCPRARKGAAVRREPPARVVMPPSPRRFGDAQWLLWGTVVIGLLAVLAATQRLTLAGRPFEQLLLVLALATGVAYVIARPRRR